MDRRRPLYRGVLLVAVHGVGGDVLALADARDCARLACFALKARQNNLELSKKAGTLYYIRMMPKWMQDWHKGKQEALAEQHLNCYQINDPLDFEMRDDVIDVRSRIKAAQAKLIDHLNSDDIKTGYTMAPDMLWPLAVALGYELPLRSGTLFHDFGDQGRPETIIEGWSLDLDAEDRWDKSVVGEATEPLEQGVGVHVVADFTGQGGFLALDRVVRETRKLTVSSAALPAGKNVLVGTGKNALVHPATLSTAWACAIRSALHDCQGQPVVLTARVPKTVSLATGYLLLPAHSKTSQPRSLDPGCGNEGCSRSSCLDPWKYLLPLNYNQRANAWEPVWLLAEQRVHGNCWRFLRRSGHETDQPSLTPHRLVLFRRRHPGPRIGSQPSVGTDSRHPLQPAAEEMAARAHAHGLVLAGTEAKGEA